VGCSSHAPSASQFMSEKNNAFNFGIGFTESLGDNYSHTVEDDPPNDGHTNYTEIPHIFNADLSWRFSNFHFGFGLAEDFLLHLTAGYSNDYLGAMAWAAPLAYDDKGTPNRPFGAMLIQQYPIFSNFKVGISEHFANNSYAASYSSDCCTLAKDYYPIYYKEVGAGIYLNYGNVSLEFRYGNELNSSNQRYYLNINTSFGIPRDSLAKVRKANP